MAKKYISEILKVADIEEWNLLKGVFIFLTTSCEATYTDDSELGEDLISISTIEENLDIYRLTDEEEAEVKAIIKEANKKQCGYIRVIE